MILASTTRKCLLFFLIKLRKITDTALSGGGIRGINFQVALSLCSVCLKGEMTNFMTLVLNLPKHGEHVHVRAWHTSHLSS